jgi:hypothetical protein
LQVVVFFLEVYDVCELLDDHRDDVDKVSGELYDKVVEVHCDLVDEDVLFELVVYYDDRVEDGFGLLFAGELFEFVGSDDDGVGEGVGVGLVDLEEAQSELILRFLIGLIEDKIKFLEGEYHGLVGHIDGFGVLVDGEYELIQFDLYVVLFYLFGFLSLVDFVDVDDLLLVGEADVDFDGHVPDQVALLRFEQLLVAVVEVVRADFYGQTVLVLFVADLEK